MSGQISLSLFCDGPCERGYPPDMPAPETTIASLRSSCKLLGWRVGLPGGKDYCPKCWAEIEER